MKTNRKMKKIILIILVSGILVGSMGGVLYYKYSFCEQKTARKIGEFFLEGLAKGDYEIEEYYYLADELKEKETLKDEYKIKEMFERTSFIYVYTLEKDIVLVTKGAVFQGISGYLITTREKMPEYYPVSLELGFDGNKIQISKISNELYKWYAGL